MSDIRIKISLRIASTVVSSKHYPVKFTEQLKWCIATFESSLALIIKVVLNINLFGLN
jgi:hypothetical protein